MSFVPYREWHDRFIEHYEGFSSRLYVDTATGHGRFQPMPSAALLDRFYNGTFTRSDSFPTPEAEFTPQVIDIVSNTRDYVREITGLPETFTYHDVGCGFGAGVWAARQLGLSATGNEANRAWVDAANPHCDGALSAEPLEEVLAGLGYEVDLFFCAHVLEHVADPQSILALMAHHISARGAAYLCVPNTHSLRAMLGGRRGDPAYQFPMHLNYFTPKSLCTMLRTVGLEPIQIETRPLDEVAPDGRSPVDDLMAAPPHLQVDPEAWDDAVCANLLGGELFVLATRLDNATAHRDPELEHRVDLAFERFMTARRVPPPDVRRGARRQARRAKEPVRRAVKRVVYPIVRGVGLEPTEIVARLRRLLHD
jgi:hypothetical protein